MQKELLCNTVIFICRNPFHLGNFSDRAIQNSGIFSDCPPDLFDLSSRIFIAPLNLKPPAPMIFVRFDKNTLSIL